MATSCNGTACSPEILSFSFSLILPSLPPVSPPPNDSPMQESLEVTYLETDSPAEMDVALPEADTQALEPVTSMEDDHFVPTADIPELESTPSEKFAFGSCFLH